MLKLVSIAGMSVAYLVAGLAGAAFACATVSPGCSAMCSSLTLSEAVPSTLSGTTEPSSSQTPSITKPNSLSSVASCSVAPGALNYCHPGGFPTPVRTVHQPKPIASSSPSISVSPTHKPVAKQKAKTSTAPKLKLANTGAMPVNALKLGLLLCGFGLFLILIARRDFNRNF